MKKGLKLFICLLSALISLNPAFCAKQAKSSNINALKYEITSLDNYNPYALNGLDNFIYNLLLYDRITKAVINGTDDQRVRRKAFELMIIKTADCIDAFNNLFNQDENAVYRRWDDFNEGKTVMFDTIRLVPIKETTKNSDGEEISLTKIQIVEPKIPMINIVYVGETYYEAKLNFDYFNSAFAQYLDDEHKDYLRIQAKIQRDLNNYNYVVDGAITVSKDLLKDWVMEWNAFSKKHPQFLPESIENNFRMLYTKDIIFDSYTTFDENDVLSKESKNAYEYLLNNLDKDCKEYKTIKKYYDILQKHQFKRSDEFDREFQKDGFESYT